MKKFLSFLIIMLICTSFCSAIVSAAEEDSESALNDFSYILIEAETGTVLEENNADVRKNAGYLSKLMSLLIVAEDIADGEYSLNDEISASQSVYGTKGAVVWLEPNDRMTVEELLKSVIIGNANDAMTVLAERSCEDIDSFIERMNERAKELGLKNTAFYSPYGYYDVREYTSAHDIAVICAELSKLDFLTAYFSTWRDFVKDESVELVNENTLARTYDRHIGFKAAHSEQSGYCIAEGGRNSVGTTYISVVLGAADEDTSFGTAKKLVNKGFSDFCVTAVMFPNEMLMPVKIRNGVDLAVEIELESQGLLVIPQGVSELKNVVVIPEYLTAPVKKGQTVGTAAFYNRDTLVCEGDIVVKNDVDKLSLGYVLKKNLLNITK